MFKRSAIPTLVVGSIVGLFALSSCGGSDAASSTVPVDADVTVVAIEGIAWDAEAYTATATDGKVIIATTNDSSLPHNLRVLDAAGVENASTLDIPRRGVVDSKSFTLAPGSYTMICTIPGHGNMKATLVVS